MIKRENLIDIFITIVGSFAVIMVVGGIWGCGYRHGQIDALSGKVEYELQDTENGERKWRGIER